MKRVWLLITNSLNETIRQKMFLNLVVFGILMVAFAQTVGNLTYRTLDNPAGVKSWGVYLSGEDTDFTVSGPTQIAEYMVFDGKSALIGDPGTYNATTSATTVEAGRWWGAEPSTARITMRNATVGAPSEWGVKGQITAYGEAAVLIEDSRIIGDLVLITEGKGRITLRNVEIEGSVTTIQNGGPIVLPGNKD